METLAVLVYITLVLFTMSRWSKDSRVNEWINHVVPLKNSVLLNLRKKGILSYAVTECNNFRIHVSKINTEK